MAKHFKSEDDVQSTAVMPARRTRRRVQADSVPSIGGTPVANAAQTPSLTQPSAPRGAAEGYVPYGQVDPSHHQYAEPAPAPSYYGDYDDYFFDGRPRGGLFAFMRGILLVLAWLMRVCALVLFVLVMVNALSVPVVSRTLTPLIDLITSYLPWRDLTLLGVDTPFGGIFRGDLALVSLALFVVDCVLCKLRAALR